MSQPAFTRTPVQRLMFVFAHCILYLTGDPHQIFSYDFMHNWSLGVLQLVIGGIKANVDQRSQGQPGQHHGARALKRLDERLLRMPRCEGFRLPTWRKYFSDPANITAHEHMAVQQVSRAARRCNMQHSMLTTYSVLLCIAIIHACGHSTSGIIAGHS